MKNPKKYIIGGKKFYLTDVINIVNQDREENFFEFIIKNSSDYEPDRILLWSNHKAGLNVGWEWFIYLKSGEKRNEFSYHYKDIISPERDFFAFAKYVKRVSPEAMPYILFGYMV